MGPLIPLLWTSGDVRPGFQSQDGSLFVCFLAIVIFRFASGMTPADCVEVSMTAELLKSMYSQTCALVEFWVGAQTHDRLYSVLLGIWPMIQYSQGEENQENCFHMYTDNIVYIGPFNVPFFLLISF